MTTRKHRTTGNPVGRPRILPYNLSELILMKLREEADPKTGLVSFSWKKLARYFGVSRSTIWRQTTLLKRLGRIKPVFIPCAGNEKFTDILYRLL